MNDWTYFANLANDEENARNNDLRNREADAETRVKVGRQRINDEYGNAFTPDIHRQYSDAQRTLNYGFADTQPGGGSVPAEAMGRLSEAYGKALLSAQDNATGQANQLRQSNEGQRGSFSSSWTAAPTRPPWF